VACAPGASIALHEHRAEHATGPEAAATAACSELLLTLRGCAQRHGADIAEHDRRSPVNLARNYYDGGRDFDVLHTLALTFASVDAASGFLADAQPTLARWLRTSSASSADLRIGAAEVALADAHDLELLLAAGSMLL